MARVPSQKGTSLITVVAALKQHPDRKTLVPERLWKYFDEHIVVSGWYPERDYFVLIEALVKTIDPRTVGGDVWRYFASVSARSDIGGQDVGTSGASTKGVYRSYATVDPGDPEAFFKRTLRLWSQYHDTGTMELCGSRPADSSVVMRLVGFHIPIEGFVRLQGYYLEEYGRLVGLPIQSRVVRSTAAGDPFCEWEHTLERNPASIAFLSSLPSL
jgi:hypothetical protein